MDEKSLESRADRPRPKRSPEHEEQTRQHAIELARLLDGDKCEDVIVLDVRGVSAVTDYLVIASGTSSRQMGSALDDAIELGERSGFALFGKSVDEGSNWMLADFVDIVVHIFEPNTRAHYDLEMMWGESEGVEWKTRGNRHGLA